MCYTFYVLETNKIFLRNCNSVTTQIDLDNKKLILKLSGNYLYHIVAMTVHRVKVKL